MGFCLAGLFSQSFYLRAPPLTEVCWVCFCAFLAETIELTTVSHMWTLAGNVQPFLWLRELCLGVLMMKTSFALSTATAVSCEQLSFELARRVALAWRRRLFPRKPLDESGPSVTEYGSGGWPADVASFLLSSASVVCIQPKTESRWRCGTIGRSQERGSLRG